MCPSRPRALTPATSRITSTAASPGRAGARAATVPGPPPRRRQVALGMPWNRSGWRDSTWATSRRRSATRPSTWPAVVAVLVRPGAAGPAGSGPCPVHATTTTASSAPQPSRLPPIPGYARSAAATRRQARATTIAPRRTKGDAMGDRPHAVPDRRAGARPRRSGRGRRDRRGCPDLRPGGALRGVRARPVRPGGGLVPVPAGVGRPLAHHHLDRVPAGHPAPARRPRRGRHRRGPRLVRPGGAAPRPSWWRR